MLMMRGFVFVPARKPGSPGSGGPGGGGDPLGEAAGDGERPGDGEAAGDAEGAEAALGAGVALGEGAGDGDAERDWDGAAAWLDSGGYDQLGAAPDVHAASVTASATPRRRTSQGDGVRRPMAASSPSAISRVRSQDHLARVKSRGGSPCRNLSD